MLFLVEYVTIAQQLVQFVWDRMMSKYSQGIMDMLDILIHIMVKYQYLNVVVVNVVRILMVLPLNHMI